MIARELVEPLFLDGFSRAFRDLSNAETFGHLGLKERVGLLEEVHCGNYSGNHSTNASRPVPRVSGNNSGMPKERPLPRQTLAKNLQALQGAYPDWHPAELARLAKVDKKTLSNYLRGARYDPRPEIVDKIARVYGTTGWLLLSPWFKPEMAKSQLLTELLSAYAEATPENRENILRVAEMAGRFKQGPR